MRQLTFLLKNNSILRSIGILALFLFISSTVSAATYYSKGSLAPHLTTSWAENRDGSGATPAGFVTAGDVFVIQNGHSMTTIADWTVGVASGAGKLQIEDGGKLTVSNSIAIPAGNTFQIDNGGTCIHNYSTMVPLFGGTEAFDVNSNFEFQLIPAPWAFPNGGFGNVIMNTSTTTNGINGNIGVVNGNMIFTTQSASAVSYQLAGGTDKTLPISGNLIIEKPNVTIWGTNGVGKLTLNVGGDVNIKEGELRLTNNATGITNLTVGGNFLITGTSPNSAKLTTTNNTAGTCQINFTGVGKNFTKSVYGLITNVILSMTVKDGASLTLNNDLIFPAGRGMTVESGATLDCGTSSVISGAGDFILMSGGTLRHANTGGLDAVITVTGTKTISGTVVDYSVSTALNDIELNQINVYASSNLINISGLSSGNAITVYNTAGQQLKHFVSSASETQISLNQGLYIVKVSTEKGIKTSKVILQ